MNTRTTHTTSILDRLIHFLGAMLMVAFIVPAVAVSQSPAPVNLGSAVDDHLGSASTFGIMAAAAITSTGLSVINGDVSLDPGTSMTGFPPGIVNGEIHINDLVSEQARIDLLVAYNYYKSLPPGVTITAGADLGALYPLGIPPGTYTSGSTMLVSTPLVLDAGGNADAIWVFQIGSSLNTGANVSLVNGANENNVFWVPTLDAAIGVGTIFYGTIVSGRDVTAMNGTTIYGRILAGATLAGTVTLQTSTVTNPVVTIYTITASAGPNGVITPSGNISVNPGDNQSFAILANPGYHVADVLVDGMSVGAVISHMFANVAANHTISASFAINTIYTITASAGPNGVITPSGNILVNPGADQSFAILANPGYHVADVLVDGLSIGAVISHTFANVLANHTISASFAINTNTYTLTVNAINGSVTKVPDQLNYNHGSIILLTAAPAIGYTFTGWSGDANGTDNPLTVTMDRNKIITANFTLAVDNHLGSASTFGLIATAAITSTGLSVINGDVSLDPGTSLTGFPPGVVNGTIHINDAASAQARADLLVAYNYYTNLPPGVTISAGADLGATYPLGIPPGTYTSGSTMLVSTPLVLDAGGNANAVWVFQIGSGLTTGANVSLLNGAQAKNVFWVPTLDATIGVGTIFYGTIVAGRDVAAMTGATIYGRVLAGATLNGTIVLDASTVTNPVVTSVENDLAPQKFALFQNYPNPFNPSTRIQYSLEKAAQVSLKVYNVLGLEVATLVNDRQEAGSYTVPFNTGKVRFGLSSGVYFYRLEAGSFVSTKKLVFMK